MSLADLGELHILLRMYIQCYGADSSSLTLLSDVEKKYMDQYMRFNGGKTPRSISNPRNAGRKSTIEPAKAEKIRHMHAGGKTIREIAQAESCSIGLVHKLIHEQADDI